MGPGLGPVLTERNENSANFTFGEIYPTFMQLVPGLQVKLTKMFSDFFFFGGGGECLLP